MIALAYTLVLYGAMFFTMFLLIVGGAIIRSPVTYLKYYRWMIQNVVGSVLPIELYGEPTRNKRTVFVINHSCNIDFLLPHMLPMLLGSFVDKYVFKFFFLRFVLSRIPTIAVDRRMPNAGERVIQEGVDFIAKNDMPLFIFPEGMRNSNPTQLMTFRRGAFEIARRGGYDIQPIVCANSGLFSQFNEGQIPTFNPKVLPLRFYFLEPIKVQEDEDPLEVAEKVRQEMQLVMGECA